MENKKLEIENYVRKFFDDFSMIDANVFSDLKKSIQENESNMIFSMESIKNNVSRYFNESPPELVKNTLKNQNEQKLGSKNPLLPQPNKITRHKFEEIYKSQEYPLLLQVHKIKTIDHLFQEMNKIK